MEKKLFAVLFSFLLSILLFSSCSEAGEWSIVGPRALGMGGANVAVANDATASYWNPAAYGFFKDKKGGDYGGRSWSGALGVGAGAQVHEDLGEEIDRISKIDFNNLDNGVIQANRVSDYITLLNELKTFNNNKDRALTASVNGVAAAQVGNFGIGGYVFGDISARGDLDLVNISPVVSGTTGVDIITQLSTASNFNNGASVPAGDYYFDSATKTNLISAIAALPGWNTTAATNYVQAMDYGLGQARSSGLALPSDPSSAVQNAAELASTAQTGGSFADNNSRLLFKGIAVAEVPLTWGRRISDEFSVGANLKYMKARVYNTSVKVFNTDFGDALDKARNDYKDSQNFGVDLGMLYRYGDTLRAGLVGRNLNSPKFDMKPLLAGDDDYLKEKAQVRAGVAYKPVSYVTLALDYDLTKNDTTVSDSYKSQNLGAGVEVNVFKVVQLRAGAYKNMTQSDIGVVYTAGLGLNLWAVNLDLGAAMSPKSTTVDGNDIPKEVRAELALSMLF